MICNALFSISNKTQNAISFANSLHNIGINLIATGGTAKFLSNHNLPVIEVTELTEFPEILDGRVKTLHPKIYAGLLAKRDISEHLNTLVRHNIKSIDLLIIDLYPFKEIVTQKDCSLETAIENIDIGGHAMLRAGAKNYKNVTVLIDPEDYKKVLQEIHNNKLVSFETNFYLAKKAFLYTSKYDNEIAQYLLELNTKLQSKEKFQYPNNLYLSLKKTQEIRYGENPHQSAAIYRNMSNTKETDTYLNYHQLQGKELSYNNIVDTNIAWECVSNFSFQGILSSRNDCVCVIVKHGNPCGAALGSNPFDSYNKALKTDPISAFGGIIAFNHTVNRSVAQEILKKFVEVLIAPAFTNNALEMLSMRKNIRVIQMNSFQSTNSVDIKSIGNSILIQSPDLNNTELDQLKIVSKRQPSAEEIKNSTFAWYIAKFVKSNAIVFCKNEAVFGIGAGQMSRIDSIKIASIKAKEAGLSLKDSVVASDAFFPFEDCLEMVIESGASCVIQPGGSIRDAEILNMANEYKISMIYTGVRHFKH